MMNSEVSVYLLPCIVNLISEKYMQFLNTFSNKKESGQVAIIILLIMVVLLTVGLSLASRTTQDVFLSQQEAESARVFNAAEVGLEDALSQDFDSISGTYVVPDNGAVSDVDTTTTITSTTTLETQVVEGAAVHLDLNGFSGNVELSWARENNCNDAASILMSIYYTDGTSSETEVVHEAFSPGNCRADEFEEITTAGASGYYRRTTVAIPANALFARLRPVYNDTSLKVTGTGLPNQYFVIRSEADNAEGEENRTVEVGRTLSTAPLFMDYALYSGAGIVQDTP